MALTGPEAALSKELSDVLNVLKDVRRPYEAQVDNILKYINHGRRLINDKDTRKGQKTGIDVFDGTALGAVNLLTDGITGYTISKSFKWFSYTLPQKINFSRTSATRSAAGGKRLDSFPEVKRWLEDCEEAMNAAFLASNIYDVSTEFVRDAATVGTVTVNWDEDIANGRIIFSVPHFRECFCAENFFQKIDTNYREYKLTLKQLVEKFGYDRMKEADPANFENNYRKNRHAERDVIHARYPRVDYDPKRLDKKNKPFASVWKLVDPEFILEESGTTNQSFVTWRWRKNSDEWYGRSPAWDAFIDVMKGNQMAKTNLTAAHKMVEPPMYGPGDLRGVVQNRPGGWTTVDDDRPPKSLNEIIQLPFGLEMQDRTDRAIREHFDVDFFLQLSQAAMAGTELTATQVIEMGGEKAAVLGPRIGRMETEALGPIHDGVFAIEQRAGRIPPPPAILEDFAGGNIAIEYLGPLAQAQKKLFRSQGVEQGLEAVVRMSDRWPEVLDLINPTESAKEILAARGFPQKTMNDDDTVKAIRATRQRELEQQQQLQQSIDVAKAMPAAGKEIHPNSAAGMMIEGAEQ